MARQTPKREDLGDSWVVDSDEADSETSNNGIHSDSRSTVSNTAHQQQQKSRRTFAGASREPELIMPSIYEDGIRSSNGTPRKRYTGGARDGRGVVMPHMSRMGTMDDGTSRSKPENMSRSGKREAAARNRRSKTASKDKLGLVLDKLILSDGGLLNSAGDVLSWLFGILRRVFTLLQTPLAYFITVYALIGLAMFTRNLLTSSVSSALSPLCRIPGSRFLDLSFCKSPITGSEYQGDHAAPAEFSQLITVQDRFDEILDDAAGSIGLPMVMKRTESSLRDLREVVRYSRLHSKGELVMELDGFIQTAGIASFDLQKFNSHIGRSVDNIINTGRWTQRVLDSISARDAGRSALMAFVSDRLLAPFQPIQFTEDAVLDQYLKHARVVQEEIYVLLAEAEALLMVLQNLEDRLGVINGICIRDEIQRQSEKDEILSLLWTKLGGNRTKLGKQDSELRLLQEVSQYRKSALAHVLGMILKLQAMSTELDELRTRVKTSANLDEHPDIPLSVHIDNIRNGIERLQIGRAEARSAENSLTRRILDGAPVEIGTGRIDA